MHLKECSKSMNICLRNIIVMGRVKWNGEVFNRVWSWDIRQIIWIIKFWLACHWKAWAFTKRGIFIHIKPNTWKLNFTIECIKHISPVWCCIGMKEINKCSIAWPNNSYFFFNTICILDEYSSFFTLFICKSTNLNSGIDDRNITIVTSNLSQLI